jgi:fumarylacetoacetase
VTWIDDPAFGAAHPFGPQTLPYGVFSLAGSRFRSVGVRVGDAVLDLAGALERISGELAFLVRGPSLDHLLREGPEAWHALRATLVHLLTDDRHRAVVEPALLARDRVRPVLPFTVADYVDFYSSRHHAENAGRIFRPDTEPLPPNWTHLPIGYHGRAGTVVVSGTPVVRPCGQSRPRDAESPVYGPSRRLDIEAEVGFVCGGPVRSRVPVDEVAEHVFGVALVNDWSARDIQAWEYQPLGPFLGKSFATSVSAWVTPLAALESARVRLAPPPHPLVSYLDSDQAWGLDLSLEVRWNGTVVSRPPFATMSWSCAQQLAHLTVNGATVRPGDLFASGTVSGPSRDQVGSFLELSWGGREPITLDSGDSRTFLADGDTVMITATAPGPDGAGQVVAGPAG